MRAALSGVLAPQSFMEHQGELIKGLLQKSLETIVPNREPLWRMVVVLTINRVYLPRPTALRLPHGDCESHSQTASHFLSLMTLVRRAVRNLSIQRKSF